VRHRGLWTTLAVTSVAALALAGYLAARRVDASLSAAEASTLLNALAGPQPAPEEAQALLATLSDPRASASDKASAWVSLGYAAPELLPAEDLARTVAPPSAQTKPNLVFTIPNRHGTDWEAEEAGDVPEVLIRKACQDETGECWAAFGFGRYGTSDDVWLAHSSDKRTWREFLFTGDTLRKGRWDDVWETSRSSR
jgi:hypothetical protein